ncbi:MAG: DNA polymerase I, partial [Anaerolineaceae bacterium]|nr:DNA polymerase I [Anaerolineaceae bacterium]
QQIAIDTETTSTDPLRAELVGLSLALQEGEGYYIPVGHHTGEKQLPLQVVIETLRPALTNPKIGKIGHNIKYDSLVLSQHGLKVAPLAFDTMIAGWLIDPSSHNLGLKNMAEHYLSANMTHIEDLIGKGKAQRSMAEVKVDTAAAYAAADAEVTLRLKPMLEKGLQSSNAAGLFQNIEMPLVPVLVEMEQAGIALDIPFFRQMSKELSRRLVEIERQIITAVGYSINLNSTQQLSKMLFESLKLTPPDRRKRTTSGHFSTSADVLEEMRGQHEVIDWILEYRELSKLKSTYVDALPQQVHPLTGRVHTSFNQTGSVTGRLASSEPNLQNIPTRTEIGRRVRHGFVAAAGMLLLSVDYSQIELRIVAHMAQDEAMLAAFKAGHDIHAATAAAIYGVPIDQVNKDQRRHAKAINFGLIYGMSPFGLTRTTGLTLAEAENFVQAYFRQFPGVKRYLDELRLLAARQGYVETMLGRRRYFPNLRQQISPALRSREEREAINAPIQGSAADIIKLAMIRLHPALQAERLSARMLLQVHDELVLECPTDELVKTATVVQQVMENAVSLSIPLLTEARSGINWGDLNPL